MEAAARILLGEEGIVIIGYYICIKVFVAGIVEISIYHLCTFTGKVRRLYDVANILTSLGLISKKVFAGGTNFRKPGFYWSGPVILPQRQGN